MFRAQVTGGAIIRAVPSAVKKGLRQGRKEARDLVLRQLGRRLGAMPANLAKRVERLDDPSMFALGDALFDLRAPADVERWIAQRNK